MEALLRELQQGPDGFTEYLDTHISASVVDIGSAAEQNIQLLGRGIAARHASISASSGGLQLSCRGRNKLRLNGRWVQRAALKAGDLLELGGHRLRILPPPPGFALAVELRGNQEIAASDFESAFRTDLSHTWLGKRTLAWVGMALALALGLALPLLSVTLQRAEQPVPAWLPSDRFWTSGPLHSAHQQSIGDRCDTCHEQLFQRVRDEACMDCHRETHDHILPANLQLTSLGEPPRCATCHREHNEPATFLVNRADGLCVDCHGENRDFGSLMREPVRGFGGERHPPFKAHLLKSLAQPAGTGFDFLWQVHKVALDEAREDSNLKFSHVQHLDGERVLRRGDSQALVCADCHRLQPDGEHFQPITMERNCVGCHELTFDPAAPDRQLPHGKPREVVQMLQDYYAGKFMVAAEEGTVIQGQRLRRRLPGRQGEQADCDESPFLCAQRTAGQEIESQFTRRGCVSCHEVRQDASASLADRYQVVPIRFTTDYYPASAFAHRSHQIQGTLTGDAACLSCHAADRSQDSADLLIPAMEQCTDCHSDRFGDQSIKLQCVSCHGYHPRHGARDETDQAAGSESTGS